MSNTRKPRNLNVYDFHRRNKEHPRESRRTTLRVYHGYHRQQAQDEREMKKNA